MKQTDNRLLWNDMVQRILKEDAPLKVVFHNSLSGADEIMLATVHSVFRGTLFVQYYSNLFEDHVAYPLCNNSFIITSVGDEEGRIVLEIYE